MTDNTESIHNTIQVKKLRGGSRGTHSFGDQLERADAGSWQIADGSTVAKVAAHRTSVGDFRVRFADEPYSWSPNRAHLETGTDTVCISKESAHEPKRCRK